MKKCKFLSALLWMVLLAVDSAVAGDRVLPQEVALLNDSLKRVYAPDRRVELFDVDYSIAGRHVMLRGVTTSAEAKKALTDGLCRQGYEVMDCLRLLPDAEELEGKMWGIVNVSVCNLRAEGDFSSEMMTQGLLGMPGRVLERDGWYRVQTPDWYIAWVHRVGIHPVTQEELSAWNSAEKVVITAHYIWKKHCHVLNSTK